MNMQVQWIIKLLVFLSNYFCVAWSYSFYSFLFYCLWSSGYLSVAKPHFTSCLNLLNRHSDMSCVLSTFLTCSPPFASDGSGLRWFPWTCGPSQLSGISLRVPGSFDSWFWYFYFPLVYCNCLVEHMFQKLPKKSAWKTHFLETLHIWKCLCSTLTAHW